MNIKRKSHLLLTSLPRLLHRHGFGIQSPWAYELIRDVLYEPLHYYIYEEQHLDTPRQRQLFRIKNHFHHQHLVIIDERGQDAARHYDEAIDNASNDTILIVEHIGGNNATLWNDIVADPRTTVTFDMGQRGLATFDKKRIKQNYIL